MSDVDLLDMLFDDSNGLMELNERSSVSQTVTEPPPSFLQLQANPKCNNYNNIHQNSLEQVSHLCSTYFEAHSDSQLSSNTKLQRKDGMGTLPLDLDLFSENECAAQTHFQAASSNLDIDWSSNFLNSSLNLVRLQHHCVTNTLYHYDYV